MLNIYKRFCKEAFNEAGELVGFEPVYGENFNFAYDVVDEIAKAEPDRRAMVWCNSEGEEHTFTFGDISRYSNMAANYFLSIGIKKGDSVMLILKRHYQFWFAILGLHKIGALGIPATNMLKKKDIVFRFEAAHVKAIICTTDGDILNEVEEALHETPSVKIKITVKEKVDGWLHFDEEFKKCSDKIERQETKATDPLLLYFTSGTTGMPKMVWEDHTYPLGHIITAKYWQNVVPDGLHLTLSDTGWMKSVWGKLYGQWLMEAGIFVCDFERFTPSELLPLFAKYKITTFCAPPTMFRFFIKEDLKKYDLSGLTYACIAGEALNPELYNQFLSATGLKLMEGFGQSETTVVLYNPVGTTPKPGSMGKPSPAYDVDLVDADGKTVPAGTVGEIVIHTKRGKPAGMFNGYYEDDDRTKSVWYDDVYHTGDTAWRDEDGYFWYVGRTDDIIKSSGYRIGPFEIESVIMELPYVLECAVTGVPDPVRGQLVKATIVLAKNNEKSEELKKEIQEYVKKQTAPYKYPRVIEFIDEMPKTISGKIRRVEIRENSK
ncbi:MAG: AMP-binding protein [Bacillota bacterium]|nr:AMP-binding protein [Bacillota bacterium]